MNIICGVEKGKLSLYVLLGMPLAMFKIMKIFEWRQVAKSVTFEGSTFSPKLWSKHTIRRKSQGRNINFETPNQYHPHFWSVKQKLQKQTPHLSHCFSLSIWAAERDKSISVNIDFMMKTCIIDEAKGTLKLKSCVLPYRTFRVWNFVTH